MDIVWFLLIGLADGWLASQIMKGGGSAGAHKPRSPHAFACYSHCVTSCSTVPGSLLSTTRVRSTL
jgi:hypothetical protein